MNRRDPNAGSRQAGGYRSDDSSWDSPRQANQWQGDVNRQTGSGWENDENERTDHFGQGRQSEGRYIGDLHGENESARLRQDDAARDRGYRGRDRGGFGQRGYNEPVYGDSGYGRGGSVERGYRFSGSQGSRGAEYPARSFDASGGSDFGSFTSEDYGGRDSSARESAGLSGGLHPSNSYRPSYGPGSWSRGRDADEDRSWREYGERRGFLQRAGDEVASWFGDDDAARRREADHRGRGPSDYTRSDERIREDINDALTHDWRVDASHVRVQVKDGEVTLEGTVDSRQDKRRAEDVADGVSGVRHVQNNLRLASTSSDRTTGRSGLTVGTSTPGYSHTATSASSAAAKDTSGRGS
ncbi:BON domain-containing protein [Novosphingobium sp. AP12]|uniref:BON domain-containing protein n=1 Tax=Novosphingobium sp. AP12 TaxID=1144305 RepID=UPI000271E264|nr:BON domain-containing protein [Novosphingobium sp. AP12]EJL29270.1 putative periplasmic or secreted lipoprotein [Novosphingobium sp. AP12]